MAISVQPVDGLINRLLQQNSRAPSVSERPVASQAARTQDEVNISSAALSQHQAMDHKQDQPQQRPSSKALESHLLSLYKSNDSLGG